MSMILSDDSIMEVKNKMEKKIRGILKTNKKVKVQLEDGSFNQSSSIGGIRWNLPEEDVQAHSSVPSRSADNPNRTLHPRQNSLKELRSLQECVKFIHHWKEQVDQVCKVGHESNPEEDDSKKHTGTSDRRVQLSLEESRKLIQEWASELQDLDQLTKDTPWKLDTENQENKKDENTNEETQMRIMEWAKELQTASETCGVQRDELGRLLRLLGLKKKRLVNLMPLLELITWSLLNEDSTVSIPQLWLLVKQRTWTAGTPRYIPNSVWSWICSAETDVILDSQTNHPWLQLSEDERKVQEAQSEADVPKSSQRFDNWPCVLGWKGYNSGRHYWEVNIARGSFWRVGVTTAESKRHGRFPMTPKAGYWALWRGPHHFYACTKPETQLPDSMVPKRVGIYIDYEEGQISFYNAETKTHIYTFSGTFKAKLYPLFALLDGRTIMTIIPPQNLSVL
ncbi:E3 ubiquitin-protein ligase TRIM39 [Scomber japonicus]|uniref:E3 ubiquitin-protein ligase TRIM39 n=1 Tax=Scomber japonicus TaxID=13676 RepID=UPI002305301B|nr:E3 ubiquitin-protein ligase TRIM39 [Scomber japonicus]